MTKKVFIKGSSIICSLADNKTDSVNRIENINNSNYDNFIKKTYKDLPFYSFEKKFKNQEEKFYEILEKTVLDAINDANLTNEEKENLAIFIGSTSMNIVLNEEANLKYLQNKYDSNIKELGFGNIADFIENLINTKNKTTFFQSACTSSSNAFANAYNLIKHNKIKQALVIGIELFNRSTYDGFKSLMLLSQSAKYMPFDLNSDGIILGESCSAVILDSQKSLPNDFECLSAVHSFDNHSVTNSKEDGEVNFNCMKKAIYEANIEFSELSCIKAHATGSQVSNTSESNSILSLFKYFDASTNITVLKPYIGHTLGACGVSEIVLLCECIKKGFIPKTVGFENKPNENTFIPLEKNILTNKATVLFNYIGFGGSNNSIILSNEK